MKVFYDNDADISIIRGKKVTIVGYGSQGFAHANNLRDSGVEVTVGLHSGSGSAPKAEKAGFSVKPVAAAARDADVTMILAPDEKQAALYEEHVTPNLKKGAALAFAHGFNIHFGFIKPRGDLDVFMVAPKGPGHLLRSTYSEGGGVPSLVAIQQDASGKARDIALSYASAIGAGRAGIIETTFREETETDLFGEQTVLCGGLTSLALAGYETLTEAGYAPEMAYFECLHELKLIVDLLFEGGLSWMRFSVSDTAEYGDVSRGPRIVTEQTRAAMRDILGEIQSGEFAKEWMAEVAAGTPNLLAARRALADHQIEQVGRGLRNMMPFLVAKTPEDDR